MRTLEDDHRRKMLFFKYNFRPHASACVLEPIFHTGGVASSILAAPTISALTNAKGRPGGTAFASRRR